MWKYRVLVKNLVTTDLKIKYKNTVLGFAWSMLNPLLIMLVLLVIFSRVLRFDIQNYAMFLLVGITSWRFFLNGTTTSMFSLASNTSIIKRVYFPRQLIVLSSVISVLISTVLEFSVFFIIFIAVLRTLYITTALLPIILGLQFLLIFGLGLILAPLFCFYKDMNHIWEILLQAGFFLSPIIYPLKIIPQKFVNLYLMNPMARIIIYTREIIINGLIPPPTKLLIIFVMALTSVFWGYKIFKRFEHRLVKEM